MANSKNDMKEDLLGNSTVKRRKAAVLLRTKFLNENYCDLLFQALKREEGSNSWQTKVELIKAIGVRKCVISGSYIKSNFIEGSEPHNLLAMVAATAFVRIQRCSLHDGSQVIELIRTGNYSVVEGALEALGYDYMIPSVEEQKFILDKCSEFGVNRPKGYTDPRYGLAASCAKWEDKLVKGFLDNCILTGDAPLKYVAENSLNHKYVKLR